MVEAPCANSEDAESPAEVWATIHNEVTQLSDSLKVFDHTRAKRLHEHTLQVDQLEADLNAELTALASERERLANALLGFVELRSTHLRLQKKHAAEMEVLKTCNRELLRRSEELASTGREKVVEINHVSRRDAAEHIEYRQVAEVMEQQQVTVGKAYLQDVRDAGERRVAELASEVKVLKERCAGSRRRQKLSFDGFKADLSLVAKKLAVLEEVAEQVNVTVGNAAQACTVTSPAANTSLQRQPWKRQSHGQGKATTAAHSPYVGPTRPSSAGCRPVRKAAWNSDTSMSVPARATTRR